MRETEFERQETESKQPKTVSVSLATGNLKPSTVREREREREMRKEKLMRRQRSCCKFPAGRRSGEEPDDRLCFSSSFSSSLAFLELGRCFSSTCVCRKTSRRMFSFSRL